MPTRKLTDLFVERVKPPARGRIEYFDAAFPGLALRVTENGGKSWCAFYRFSGRLRRFTIGHYPAIKPAQARKEAAAALDRVREGFDPAEEKRVRRDLRSPDAHTFSAIAYDYLDRHLAKNNAASTYEEAKRDLEHDALPKWGKRPIASISRRDVIDLFDGVIARGAEVQANRTLARLRALFNWAIEKDRLSASPVARMKLPTKEIARDRVLSDDELRWFWAGCDAIDWPFGPLAKLLLLTLQRRDEVAGMEWSELNLPKRTWTIPREKVKNKRAHEVHLSDAAIAVLQSLPRVGDGLVFTTTGETAVSGFSRAKRRLNAAMIRERRRSLGLPEEDKAYRRAMRLTPEKSFPVEIPQWTLHDLRRTGATGMAGLGFPPHVVDKVLNHVSGTIRGVAAVYNRFEYLEERRAALEAWGRYVTTLLAPTDATIVSLSWAAARNGERYARETQAKEPTERARL
jgi:integrase